jgi:hypothetical protein
MRNTARQTRVNRTITVDFHDETTYVKLLDDRKAFVEFVLAFLLALGFQLKHKATCGGGGCLTRHSHYLRVRVGGVTIWRIQCTTCKAVFTILPHFILRYRQMRPEVARDALLATQGGLRLERCAVIGHISPMAIYRLVCAFDHKSLGAVLTRWGLPLPTYVLADEKHSRCLAENVYLPDFSALCARPGFMRAPGEIPMKVLMTKGFLAMRSHTSKPCLSNRELAGSWFTSMPVMPGGTGRRNRCQNFFSFTYFHDPSAARPLGWALRMTNGKVSFLRSSVAV